MNLYTLYVEDDRYSVPTMLSAELVDDAHASSFTVELLSRSEHYLAVDVWEGDRHVLRQLSVQ